MFTPIILIHLFAALGAVAAGAAMMVLKKGTRLHKLLGRGWVVLMATTALVSFGIQSRGHFSWIHLLSVASLLILGKAIHAAMNGRILAHRRGMTGVYVGLIVAGAFTLLPHRRLGQIVWGAAGLI